MNITPNNSIRQQNFCAYSITDHGLKVLNNLEKASERNEFAALIEHFKHTKYANLFLDAEDSFCPETGECVRKLVPYIEIPDELDLSLHKYIKNVRIRPYNNSDYNLQVMYNTIQNKLCSSIIDFPYSVAKNLKNLLNAENCIHSRSADNIRTFGDAIESKFIGKEPHKPELSLLERLNERIDKLFQEQNY